MPRNVGARQKRPWQDIAQEAQAYRDASITRVRPDVPQLPLNLPKNVLNIPRNTLSEGEIHITEAAPENLLSMLASGELTATAVTTAFLRRAGLAQKLVCSYTVGDVFPRVNVAT
jgi:amidase